MPPYACVLNVQYELGCESSGKNENPDPDLGEARALNMNVETNYRDWSNLSV